MWKDKGLKIVMLSTNDKVGIGCIFKKIKSSPFPLSEEVSVGGIVLNENPIVVESNEYFEAKYLYLLSDEEIKEGDIYLDDCNDIRKAVTSVKEYWSNRSSYKKIIASTDPSLNLPQFPSSFLEEYVKRYNSKKSLEVEVKYESYWEDYHGRGTNEESDFCYNLNRLKVNPDNTISIRFKEEKIYSRSEVEKLCEKAFYAGEAYRTGSCEGFKQIHPDKHEWIKENLK